MSGDETDIFSESITVQDGPHHSTPIKDGQFKRPPPRLGRVTARVEPSSPGRYAVGEGHQVKRSSIDRTQQNYKSRHSILVPKMETSGPLADISTIEKQRREIQLLVQELRDRDGELNETVSAHSQQLLAWERDRQRLLTLEQKNARYESELQRKRKQLEAAMLKLKSAQNETQNNSMSLSLTQEQLQQLSIQKQNTETHVDNLEKHNVSLNDSLKAMSGTVGQLEAREQELLTLLRIKEREIEQATSTVLDLNTRVQQLDLRCQECQNREAEALHRATQWKQKYTQARTEIESLGDTLKGKDTELESKGREVRDVHQQMTLLQEEMLISAERERRKDEMIESLRAKQERILAELRSVRELYERQQREITLMQLTLDSSKENSNQNSHLDYSISLDESINYPSNQPIQPVSPLPRDRTVDSRHVSFEEKLSTFLDVDTDMEAVSHLDSSPASKLQRLLTESRHMIESLEKTTLPASTSQEQEGLEGQNQSGEQAVDRQAASHNSSQRALEVREIHGISASRQNYLADSHSRTGASQSYQRDPVGTSSLSTVLVNSDHQQTGYPRQLTTSHGTQSQHEDSVRSQNERQFKNNEPRNFPCDEDLGDGFIKHSKLQVQLKDNFPSQNHEVISKNHASNIYGTQYENDSKTTENSNQYHQVLAENHSESFVHHSHCRQKDVQRVTKSQVKQYRHTNAENSSDTISWHEDLESSTNNFVQGYPQTDSDVPSGNFAKESHGRQDDIHGTSNNFGRQNPKYSQSRSNSLSEDHYQDCVVDTGGSLLRSRHCQSPVLAGFDDSETSDILRRQVNS